MKEEEFNELQDIVETIEAKARYARATRDYLRASLYESWVDSIKNCEVSLKEARQMLRATRRRKREVIKMKEEEYEDFNELQDIVETIEAKASYARATRDYLRASLYESWVDSIKNCEVSLKEARQMLRATRH